MMAIDSTKSRALPSSMGTWASRLWTMFRSEMERLTIWPVCSWSWRVPSSRSSDSKSSVRMSCWTSSDSWPPRYRRV